MQDKPTTEELERARQRHFDGMLRDQREFYIQEFIRMGATQAFLKRRDAWIRRENIMMKRRMREVAA